MWNVVYKYIYIELQVEEKWQMVWRASRTLALDLNLSKWEAAILAEASEGAGAEAEMESEQQSRANAEMEPKKIRVSGYVLNSVWCSIHKFFIPTATCLVLEHYFFMLSVCHHSAVK